MIIDIAWAIHDVGKDGSPPSGSIRISDRLWQKLVVRTDDDPNTWHAIPLIGITSAKNAAQNETAREKV